MNFTKQVCLFFLSTIGAMCILTPSLSLNKPKTSTESLTYTAIEVLSVVSWYNNSDKDNITITDNEEATEILKIAYLTEQEDEENNNSFPVFLLISFILMGISLLLSSQFVFKVPTKYKKILAYILLPISSLEIIFSLLSIILCFSWINYSYNLLSTFMEVYTLPSVGLVSLFLVFIANLCINISLIKNKKNRLQKILE